MAAREHAIDFPTLWVAHDWVERHCVVPDRRNDLGDHDLLALYDWQTWALLNFYRVKLGAVYGQLAPAFYYRRSQIVLPQKAGKAPYTAAHICVEAVGPALFGGWAQGGETWDCRDHGCGCGWMYEYEPGEPMGMPWGSGGSSVPLIQVTAYSKDQTDNVYDALRPMIDKGPLCELIPNTGEEFIRLPGGGEVAVVTSNALSRLGQRLTFGPQDETGIWFASNKMIKVAETQRRGLAAMGGRAEETTNAWDPHEHSVAQRTAEAGMDDVFRLHPLPPANLSYANKRERRKIHEAVYRETVRLVPPREPGCPHVDLDGIDAEAAELFLEDPPQAERFYGNRCKSGQGVAVEVNLWTPRLAAPRDVDPGTRIGLGFDGSISGDATFLRACTRDGYSWLLHKQIRPPGVAGRGWSVDIEAVDDAVDEAFATYEVGMFFPDPPKWRSEIQRWARLYGDKIVLELWTNQERRFAPLVDMWLTAIANGSHTHDDDPDTNAHVAAAHKRKSRERDDENDKRTLYVLVKGEDGAKIDGAVADVLAFGAAMMMTDDDVVVLEGSLMA